MAMERLFQLMQEKHASDLFLAAHSPVHLKIGGKLVPVNQQALTPENIEALLAQVASPAQMADLAVTNELNMGVSLAGVGRFRLSAFRQRGSVSAVFRYIPGDIPDLQDLKVPSVLADLIMAKRGLLLVVGATGSGKSTTIAAMLDHRNAHSAGHILTLEDPIEFLFKNKQSIVNQREIGSDATSFATALRNSMRQAPDCILIGEIRDKEAMGAAIAYAQSGHLVVATLHANNSYNALNRIIGFYPVESRMALMQDLSSAVKAIVSQRLVPALHGGARAAAVEVMVNSRAVAELIEAGRIGDIKEAMDNSMSPGSQSFEQALVNLVRDGVISAEEALANADSATNLLWQLNNALDQKEAAGQAGTSTPSASFSGFTLDT
ncbi:type IV pili twitching motility protein PilT [Duganella sp. Leaf126]|uniref:PilT/PilU family type 4a pilus ATPase n=1 Tax=Duganella sp. Leaf126 TaxID=1736266 RepID=UPI0006FE45CD|nr:PilT/PilU family type 4a pilus ATPase [Duganella sp. Leaf126]KQQ39959.1 type IV pili twitching motility protein PilT [Duganella sp. Leaf126]